MEAMTHSGKAGVTLPADDQIKVVREFDAPPHLVYRAVTEPELVKRWWGAQRGAMTVATPRRTSRWTRRAAVRCAPATAGATSATCSPRASPPRPGS